MKNVLTKIGIAVYLILLVAVSAQLFFENEFDTALVAIHEFVSPQAKKQLVVGISDVIVSRDPRANDVGSRMYTQQIFEPLLRRTPTLELESALALSYGMISPTEWEFRIRPNVQFHDGSTLTPALVKEALELSRAQTSGVSDFLASIKSITVAGESIHVNTASPDVLLPQKMASVLIFKQVSTEFIGTGPYVPLPNEVSQVKLATNESYWGGEPRFGFVQLEQLTTKRAKEDALKNQTVDVLLNPPADFSSEFSAPGYSLVVRPGLETDMLLLNVGAKSPFADPSIRKQVQKAVDAKVLARFGHGFATVVNQLASPEIFGFNPELGKSNSNVFQQVIINSGESSPVPVPLQSAGTKTQDPFTLDIPFGLETFGKTIVRQLANYGFKIALIVNKPIELNNKIVQSTSPFYFFGWKHDLGDTLPFLSSVIHSRVGDFGSYNGMNYVNAKVDALIEQALATSDLQKRRELQREVMRIIIEDDAIAVPLFSPDVLYAVRTGLKFTPRVDGFIIAAEM